MYSQSNCQICNEFISTGICIKEPCEGCDSCGLRICNLCVEKGRKLSVIRLIGFCAMCGSNSSEFFCNKLCEKRYLIWHFKTQI